MGDEIVRGGPLTREMLFRMIADEACRDGVIEPYEKAILESMARFLRLEPDEVKRIAYEARDRFQSGALGEQRPLAPRELYAKALEFARSDGQVDGLEEQMLAALRKLFRLTDDDHRQIMTDLESEQTPAAPSPTAEQKMEAPRVPLPKPGTTTGMLGARLAFDPLEAWRQEHCYWYPLRERASEPAQQGWDSFVQGLARGDEEEMYRGLDALDDVLNDLEGVRVVDVLLALAVLRWSRVLLKTGFSANQEGEARTWPGRDLYQRLCVKMSPILITIDHFRSKAGMEEGLVLVLVYLLEDLCLLVERRQAEPLTMLGHAIPMVAKIFAKSEVAYRAADLFPPLAARVARQGGAVAAAFVAACREACRALPQNHPIVVAADGAIRSLAPDQSLFPKDFRPRSCNPPSPAYAPARQRLDRLIAEVSRQEEEERLLGVALAAADLSPVEAARTAATAAYRKNGMDPEKFLFRHLVAMILPSLESHPRPVIAFFSLGNGEGHHEEMKGGWIPLSLKSLDGSGIQVVPDFSLFPSTSMVSVPLDKAGAEALKDALDRSGGAYDVALVDPGRKGARIWHQVGDLDPTGNLHRVEKDLLPAGNGQEAERCLDQALARHPWLSRAWVQKGLAAKRAGDLKAARQAFERAVEVQPHDPHSLTRIGVLDKGEDRMAPAEEVLRQALRILPTEPSAIVTLASLALGRVAGGESAALPLWDYYVAGLHASQGEGPDFREIAAVGDSLNPALARIVRVTPVDWTLYI